MTKILIEIDTDTQRVVPVEPTQEMIDAMPPVEEIGYWAMYEAAIASAPQPEPVDADLHRDAERLVWAMNYMGMGNGHSIQFCHHVMQRCGTGDLSDCRTYIDFAMSQGEQKCLPKT